MKDESRQLVELMLGDAEARLKHMKASALKVANALTLLRDAEQTASEAISEYMSASGTSKSQLIADLALSSSEARLLGLIAPSRARKEQARPAPDAPEVHDNLDGEASGAQLALSTASGNDAIAVTEPAPQSDSMEGGQWHA